ncbi:MAG: class I SAM-dependent methyltransferase [Deltaproteobacteria bacterium]|nr:class I SAM-dependent methyltransferase [Deltaproteobacteria bacterium]
MSEQLKPHPCDLCGGTRFEKCGPPFEDQKLPRILKCSTCGLVFTAQHFGGDGLKRLYDSYYSETEFRLPSKIWGWAFSLRRNLLLRRFYHFLFGNYVGEILGRSVGRVLDVGCGKGGFMEELRRLGREPFGVEPSPEAALLCRKKGLPVQEGLFGEVLYPEEFFDTIVFLHSLEHLPSSSKALQEAFRILRPGGRVFIFCPNLQSYMARWFGESWAGWHLPFHLYHFTPKTLRRLVLDARFRVVQMRTVTPDILFHTSLKDHPASRSTNPLKLLLRLVRLFPFRLALAMIFRFLDLVFPGEGECLQVELEKRVGTGGR